MKKHKGPNFIPALEKYLVKVEEAVTQTPGGILIPETGRERPMEGSVQAVNEAGDPIYAVGDLILFGKYSGTEVIVDGLSYLLLKEEEILGKRI